MNPDSEKPEAAAPDIVTPKTSRRKLLRFLVIAALIVLPFLIYLVVSMMKSPDRATVTVAVMPFSSGDTIAEDQFIIDGIMEETRGQLSRIAQIVVLSQRATAKYRGSSASPGEVGKALGARYILQGSVNDPEGHMTIEVHLCDAGVGGAIVWRNTYQGDLENMAQVVRSMVFDIAGAINTRLTPEETRRIAKLPTQSSEAYACYLRGRELYRRYKKQDNEDAIENFKRALALDSNYALAYAGLGDAYAQKTLDFGGPESWLDSSIVVCRKAITVDSNLAEAYKALGLVYFTRSWFDKALEQNAHAVNLNPNYAEAVSNFGVILSYKGDLVEALRWIDKGIILNPTHPLGYILRGTIYAELTLDSMARISYAHAHDLDPDDLGLQVDLAWQNIAEKKYRDATVQSQKALTMDSLDASVLEVSGFSAWLAGDTLAAQQYFLKLPGIDSLSEGTIAAGVLEQDRGRAESAQKILARSRTCLLHEIEIGNEFYTIPYNLAVLSMVERRQADCYTWLQRAIDAGWAEYRWAEADPLLINIRRDVRFRHMMQQVKGRIEEMKDMVVNAGSDEK